MDEGPTSCPQFTQKHSIHTIGKDDINPPDIGNIVFTTQPYYRNVYHSLPLLNIHLYSLYKSVCSKK